jgi:DivIVA domain-containing protein
MPETTRFQRPLPARDEGDAPHDVDFPIVLRGYDRASVDAYVDEMTRLVRDLESTQLRENVVQRALDEVGEQTSSILQRAHETAEEITARSRAKAEGRLQRAEREAEILRRDADEYAERIVADARSLWDERQRLLDDLRSLADEVLGTADDASDRLPEPEMLRTHVAEREEAEAVADATAILPGPDAEPLEAPPTDQPTVEVEAQQLAEAPLAEPTAPPDADPADEPASGERAG